MGRIEKSQGFAPPAIRKDIRAKQARRIINKVIPAILASNARARKGVEGSELVVDPGPVREGGHEGVLERREEAQYVKRKGQGRRKAKGGDEIVVREGHEKKGNLKRQKDPLDDFSALSISPPPPSPTSKPSRTVRTVRIITTDTLTVAHMLSIPTKSGSKTHQKKTPNVCVLNMASPLRPGGGVLTGATSQEEFLCARTTLLPSLKESFYRLPEVGGIYTHDVLVFRDASPLGQNSGELAPGERYWIDVISAGMLRFPELEGQDDEGKGGRLSKKDREIAEKKMKALLRMAATKGAKKLVLGAWGCGAYGNPVGDIARSWKKILVGDTAIDSKKIKAAEKVETWDDLEEVVFAITSKNMAEDFAQYYGAGIKVESESGGKENEDEDDEDYDGVAEELRRKIQEMEIQLSQVWNPDLKARMGIILDGLRSQLKVRDTCVEEEDDDNGAEEYSFESSSDEDLAMEETEEGNDDNEDDEESTGNTDIHESGEAERFESNDQGKPQLLRAR